MAIKLRKANLKDSADILRWRNDPETVKVSFSRAPIGAAEHQKWFAAVLKDKARRLYIAENQQRQKLGMIRFDLLGKKIAEVSVNLSPDMRGKGYGTKIIVLGAGKMKGFNLLARTKLSNPASVKAFEKAGYRRWFNYDDKVLGSIQVLGMVAA